MGGGEFTLCRKYFSKLYFDAIGEKVIPPLIYSVILHKWVLREDHDSTRYRLNVMLEWESGYMKSSILLKLASMLPVRCNELTSSSSAAIRGSFVGTKIYVPELLLNDILIIPELTPIIRGDDDTIGAFLVALEEGVVRISLIKGGAISKTEEDKIKTYGASIEDDRLVYKNTCVVWTATHTVDMIPESLRDALLSRFYLVHLDGDEIDRSVAWKNPNKLVDPDIELKIAEWLEEMYNEPDEPDHEFADRVLMLIRRRVGDNLKPRDVGNLRRMILAHHSLMPMENEKTVALQMLKLMPSDLAGMTTRERIASLIFHNPHTMSEIIEKLGVTKSNLAGHLKRMGAQKLRKKDPETGRVYTYYYLESIG